MERSVGPGTKPASTALQRYAEYFDTVEVNSTFYRLPRIATLERWRGATPGNFRFCAKLPKAITHESGLIGVAAEVVEFCALIAHLRPKLGPLLVQLPPSLELDGRAASRFFRQLAAVAPAPVVVEPRHPSWFSARAGDLLSEHGAGRVAADPALCEAAAEPGGARSVSYFRWHGSPRMYFSAYEADAIRSLAARAADQRRSGSDVYCIFDNTALGAAAVNAFALKAELGRSARKRLREQPCLANTTRRPSCPGAIAAPFLLRMGCVPTPGTVRRSRLQEGVSKMKATALLESQHRKVEALFKKLEGGRSEPGPVLEELANSLAAHMAIEQDIFYPAVKEVDDDLVNEAYEEHSVAEIALKRLLATEPDDELFQARVITLKELIEHHVEEEEKELFPEVEKTIDEALLTKLGKEMKTRFDEVLAAGFEASVPKGGLAKTSADVSLRGAKAGKKSGRSASAA